MCGWFPSVQAMLALDGHAGRVPPVSADQVLNCRVEAVMSRVDAAEFRVWIPEA